jgi:hypothetical protein
MSTTINLSDALNSLGVGTSISAFNLINNRFFWRKAAKFISTKSFQVTAEVRTTTGYARIMNFDRSLGSILGNGDANYLITLTSKTPPNNREPRFYAILPCDSGGDVTGADITYLDLSNQNVTAVDIKGLDELLTINLNFNHLTSFAGAKSLLTIKLINNSVSSLSIGMCSELAALELTNNQLERFSGVGLGSMFILKLNNNLIFDFVLGDMELFDAFFYNTALDLSNQQLDAATIQTIYEDLPDATTYGGSYPHTIDVTGNPGAGTGSGTDPSVATDKGWTVVGDVA